MFLKIALTGSLGRPLPSADRPGRQVFMALDGGFAAQLDRASVVAPAYGRHLFTCMARANRSCAALHVCVGRRLPLANKSSHPFRADFEHTRRSRLTQSRVNARVTLGVWLGRSAHETVPCSTRMS